MNIKTKDENLDFLKEALEYCKRYLPRQGRLEDFIHHNTLHAFTDRSFDEAVCEASVLYGNTPYPKLRDYHRWMVRGEIEKNDLFKIIEEEVPDILGKEFRLGTSTLMGTELIEVLMSENAPYKFSFFEIYGRKFRNAERIFRKWNQLLLRFSHQGKFNIFIPHLNKRTFFEEKSRIFKEALDETQGLVLRCLSAYFDRGISYLELPERKIAFIEFFFRYFKHPPLFAPPWRKHLSKNIEKYHQTSTSDILFDILTCLAIPSKEWKHFLFSLLYKFKGWSAFIKTLEHIDNTLFQDFAAILVLCELSKIQDHYKNDDQRIGSIGKNLPSIHPVRKIYENNLRAIIRYLLTRKLNPKELMQISEEELLPLFEMCLMFHNFLKRELFQKALDRKSEKDFLSAILSNQKNQDHDEDQPKFIALFCIDEREESVRRHLEECEPGVKTEGTAGHFGLNIEFKGYRRSHYRKLCLAPQTPFVHVREQISSSTPKLDKILNRFGKIIFWIERATLHPLYGMLVTLTLSPLISFILFLRVFFPRFCRNIKIKLPKTTLVLESKDPEYKSRLVKAMAEVLIASGLKNIYVPFVFMVGHGSTSLNNPHEAAHDCGALAGGRGEANARLFSQLANDLKVREQLNSFGVTIEPHTRFIGAYHNTSSDDVDFMDLPESISPNLKTSMDSFRLAAKKNAFERNRRFLDDPIAKNLDQAKNFMVRRSLALDQVRPEYGHATNAYLVIGPRYMTRGLFMDRRAFLSSYQFEDDPDGRYLKGILNTVIPVCVGINLEYYFSWVDRQGYGCDTKIPHNINGLNGVMNGYMSDLLLGLPLQMTEIHEPVRLKVLIIGSVELVKNLLKESPEILHEIENEWFYLSVLEPETKHLFSWSKGNFHMRELPKMNLPHFKHSLDYIGKNRDFLGFALKR